MPILANSSKGILKQKPTILLYGVGGLGKDTFFSRFPKPFFIDAENGTGDLDVNRLVPDTYDEVVAQIKAIAKEDCETLVLSGMDTLEKMLYEKIMTEDNVKSMEKARGGFGKGYIAAMEHWAELQVELHRVRDLGIMVCLVGHSIVYSYNDPTAQSYDRYRLNLWQGKTQSAAELWFNWADIVLFAKKKVYQKDENRAMDEGKHYIYTQERAAFLAKSRRPLPFEMELDATKFLEALSKGVGSASEIYAEGLKLASGIKDLGLQSKAKERLEKNKTNAAELSVVLETIKTILTKE